MLPLFVSPLSVDNAIAARSEAHARLRAGDNCGRFKKKLKPYLVCPVSPQPGMQPGFHALSLLVATSIAVGNYVARVMYDGVTNGFGSQSWLTWVLPFAVLIGMVVFCCSGFAAYFFCYKKKICWKRPSCCIAPKEEDSDADEAATAEDAKAAGAVITYSQE